MSTPSFLDAPASIYKIRTKAPGPSGSLPFTKELLLNSPSGDVFGFSMNAGMGWDPALLNGGQVLILSTSGGLRQDDGTPIALGFHTGHWELTMVMREAAREFKSLGQIPYAAFCSDPCDGRSQGTPAMMDSLPYRNTAAEAFGRLIRSLPARNSVMGVATCDKGLPAMMMALAGAQDLPGILVPGGVTLPPENGEDAGTVQSVGARFAHGELSLDEAAALGCSACATPGGGCQFLGTAATSQVIGEALGMSLPHSALAPSGEEVWLHLGRASAQALKALQEKKITMKQILTHKSFENAMTVHAAFGGSTNLLLHLPAIAFHAGVTRPRVDDWIRINQKVSRIVDVLPNGPVHHPTVQVYLAGGVPEVMLHLRDMGLLNLDCMTVSGLSLEENLNWWEKSERRKRFREILHKNDSVNPNDVIMEPKEAIKRGIGATLVFPKGNIAPEGSVVKSTAIDSSLLKDGVYEHTGPARVFITEDQAIAAIKSTGPDSLKSGDIVVLIGRGPLGAAMPETSQITMALKYTKALKNIALITDGRFSGFSSGPCIGHVGPEALAKGPIGKVHDGDVINIHIDQKNRVGKINLLMSKYCADEALSIENGNEILTERLQRTDLKMDPWLPPESRLWAALQAASGGTWNGCVYDTERIIDLIEAGKTAPKTLKEQANQKASWFDGEFVYDN